MADQYQCTFVDDGQECVFGKNHRVNHHHLEDGRYVPVVMPEQAADQPADLPAHEATVRSYAADSADVVLRRALTAVLAELDRLRAVEKAAAAYVYTDAGDPQIADRYEELEALIRAGDTP